MADIKIIHPALKSCSERYSDVALDHHDMPRYTDLIDAQTVPANDPSDWAAIAIHEKPALIESLSSINKMGSTALDALSAALYDTNRIYQETEEENVLTITRAHAEWGAFGDISMEHGKVELTARTDWSHGNAFRDAHVGEDLPTGDAAWKQLEDAMAVSNIDVLYKGLDDPLTQIIEGICSLSPLFEKVNHAKGSWLPVYQLGEGLKREGNAYVKVGENLEHDREVLASNWDGPAWEQADGTLAKCYDWFVQVGENIRKVGADLSTEATEAVATQKQIVYVNSQVLGAFPGVGTAYTAYTDVWLMVNLGQKKWSDLESSWRILIAAITSFISIAWEFFGLVQTIWGYVQEAAHILAFASKTGHHGLDVPKPINEF